MKTLSSSLLQSIGDSSVADIDINKDGSVLYAAFGNFVKMIDLKTYVQLKNSCLVLIRLIVTIDDKR